MYNNNMMYGQYPYSNQFTANSGMQMQPNNQVTNNGLVNTQTKQTFTGSVVNSFAEVREFPVPIDGSVLLIHESEKKMYIKRLNSGGVPIINTFRYEEYIGDICDTTNDSSYSTLEKRIADIESKLKNQADNKSTVNKYETSSISTLSNV